jgi:rhodanese-related sulfurtransferase
MNQEITPAELKYLLDSGEDVLVVDVREDDELVKARFENALHIRMAQIPDRIAELYPKDQDIVVLCHLGSRSGRVASFLRESGFSNVANLAGGIDAWSREVDSKVPTY